MQLELGLALPGYAPYLCKDTGGFSRLTVGKVYQGRIGPGTYCPDRIFLWVIDDKGDDSAFMPDNFERVCP